MVISSIKSVKKSKKMLKEARVCKRANFGLIFQYKNNLMHMVSIELRKNQTIVTYNGRLEDD